MLAHSTVNNSNNKVDNYTNNLVLSYSLCFEYQNSLRTLRRTTIPVKFKKVNFPNCSYWESSFKPLRPVPIMQTVELPEIRIKKQVNFPISDQVIDVVV